MNDPVPAAIPDPLIGFEHLTPFVADLDEAKAREMIDDAIALAIEAAPCLADPAFNKRGAVRAILRGALLRWIESGSGALSSVNETAGPFSTVQTFDTRQDRNSMYRPAEINALRRLCGKSGFGAFAVDLAGTQSNHYQQPWPWYP